MTIHKRTRVTPLDRQEIWKLYGTRQWTIVALAQEFRVSRPTIYKVINRARRQEFAPRKSTNTRFLQAHYGMKRLAKVEAAVEAKKKALARRYNKDYPGEMIHLIPNASPCSKERASTYFVSICLWASTISPASYMPGSFLIKHRVPQRRFLDKC